MNTVSGLQDDGVAVFTGRQPQCVVVLPAEPACNESLHCAARLRVSLAMPRHARYWIARRICLPIPLYDLAS